ncbi:thiamine biosynthesis protein ApbE [Selenomonas sp. oral taxon 126]|uniref:FAD:protein FMN transferase n=1 Tax=Selenomonas sp. oral taxon 126 TaxID=712528 RepID=UPI0008078EAD|nr:FAD:protein FMN transferase [Selenomonas sp. oral taxon 126]ANR70508.1 thiamine biosynthesis protein ApbE [Selenomonas sp. oral taxon 126]
MIGRFFTFAKIPALACLCAALLLGGCGGGGAVTAEETKLVMGTVARLTVRADEITSQAALRDGLAVLTQTEHDADGAAIADLEAAAGTGEWREISPALYETLTLAQEVARRSDGAFDVTSGALTELWEQARMEKIPPSAEEIAAARTQVGYTSFELRSVEEGGQTRYEARLTKAGMKIDRGALIKGLALDGIRSTWQKADIKNALADLGTSSILGMGVNEAGEPWQIGIRNPRGERAGDALAVLPLSNEVLSASGDDERFFLYEGRRYHHLIDPRTGYPADTGLASVVVTLPLSAEDLPAWQGHMGLLSDMLSTAVFVLGPEAGRALLADFPPALVILIGTDGRLVGE